MKKFALMLAIIALFLLVGCDSEPTVATESSNVEIIETTLATHATEPSNEPSIVQEYDTLQTLFLSITPDTTIEELDIAIANEGLCFTCKEYNKSRGGKSISYKIAYSDGVAKQSHADSGDYLDVDFDKDTGTLMTAQYAKSGARGSALLYCYGTWFDFSDNNAEDYAGYYLINTFSKEPGITIKYSNGRETETNYYLYSSPEELIQSVIRSQE